MRRVLAAFLLLSLLAGQLSMLGALLGRYHAQQQMHHRIDAAPGTLLKQTNIQHLTLSHTDRHSPRSSFVRIEEGEFRYRGKLYDVVREEWEGDLWHVWVVHDREEEQYLEALARSVEGPMLEGRTAPVQKRLLVYRPLAVILGGGASVPSPQRHAQSYSQRCAPRPQAPYLAVPHPPPWS